MTDPIPRLNAALEGRYRIERKLGEGGMAVVYLADDLRHERRVALKVLKPELAAVVGAERFLAEIKTTANLQHPHILPLFDSGEADGFLYYVMPYVEGETLRERIDRERQLPVEEAVRIATAVANALHAAHEAGVIHRDIKPGNILLTRDEPVVADFGIALAVGAAGGSRLTETGLSMGTPYYMSPEQATGDQIVGAASDIYSLACVLYEMLVGEPPYQGSTAQAVLGRIIQSGPVSARESRPSVPAHVDATIRKGLERIPGDRFRDAREFTQAMSDSSFRHGEEAATGSRSARRWNGVTVVLAALVVIFGGYSAWTFLQPDSSDTVGRYPSPFVEGQEPISVDWGHFIVSRFDGSISAFVGRRQEGGRQLWFRRWDDLEATPIPGTEGGFDPDISPDGTEIAFERSHEILVAPMEGGPVRKLMLGTSPIWDDQGYIYARLGVLGTGRVPAGGGAVDTISRVGEGERDHLPTDVLPGGEKMLLSVVPSTGPREVRVLDLESGDMRFLVNAWWAKYVDSGHLVYDTGATNLVAVPFDPDKAEITGPAVSLEANVWAWAVSRDGTLLYSTGIGSQTRQLVWVTRAGEVTPVDTTWTFNRAGADESWRISPDGSRVVVEAIMDGVNELWVMELDDGRRWRLTFDEMPKVYPEWTPEGDSIMYAAGSDPQNMDIYTRRADGTGEPVQVVDAEMSLARGIWSHDREWLILRSTGGDASIRTRDIFIMRPGRDTVPQPLIGGEGDQLFPALSPDGRWLAYASNESGRLEVYVRPFPDVDSGRWQISTRGGSGPRWSGDGREIFFNDEGKNMVVARVDGSGSAFSHEQPQILFTPPDDIELGAGRTPYAVTPDGQRFLMARMVRDPNMGSLPEIILVTNFDQVLRERVPN